MSGKIVVHLLMTLHSN